MVKVQFEIETDNLRDPKLVIRLIHHNINLFCGDSLIIAPEGYLTEKDLK